MQSPLQIPRLAAVARLAAAAEDRLGRAGSEAPKRIPLAQRRWRQVLGRFQDVRWQTKTAKSGKVNSFIGVLVWQHGWPPVSTRVLTIQSYAWFRAEMRARKEGRTQYMSLASDDLLAT